MTSLAALVLLLVDPPAPASSTAPAAPNLPSLPGLPTLPAAPAGAPTWLVVFGYLCVCLGLLGFGGVAVKLLDRRKIAAEAGKTQVDADEVFTRVAVTLVEPLRDRLESTERRLSMAEQRHERERQVYEQEIDKLRAKVREASAETDQLARDAYRLRRLVQQWHRSIMDPAATLEWLRTLVGPDEPAI